MINGYVKLYRKFIDWEWYHDPIVKSVFIHLLLTASHKDFQHEGESVSVGQIITGRKKLSKELNISESQVRTALDKLKATGEIATKTTNKFSVITVVNWEDYQINEKFFANKSPTNRQQIATIQEGKEDKEIYILSNAPARTREPSFEEVEAFVIAENLNVNARKFFNYYNRRRWRMDMEWTDKAREWDKTERKPVSKGTRKKNTYSTSDMSAFDKHLNERAN